MSRNKKTGRRLIATDPRSLGWALRDSNPQPRDYESPALTVAPRARYEKGGDRSRRQQILGGDKGVRTPDLVTASHALSQLSYIPVRWCVSYINRLAARVNTQFEKSAPPRSCLPRHLAASMPYGTESASRGQKLSHMACSARAGSGYCHTIAVVWQSASRATEDAGSPGCGAVVGKTFDVGAFASSSRGPNLEKYAEKNEKSSVVGKTFDAREPPASKVLPTTARLAPDRARRRATTTRGGEKNGP